MNRGLRSECAIPNRIRGRAHRPRASAMPPFPSHVLFMQKAGDVCVCDDASESWHEVSGTTCRTDSASQLTCTAHEPDTIKSSRSRATGTLSARGQAARVPHVARRTEWEAYEGMPQTTHCYVNVLRTMDGRRRARAWPGGYLVRPGAVYGSADGRGKLGSIVRDLTARVVVEVQTHAGSASCFKHICGRSHASRRVHLGTSRVRGRSARSSTALEASIRCCAGDDPRPRHTTAPRFVRFFCTVSGYSIQHRRMPAARTPSRQGHEPVLIVGATAAS